jgi:hypothetical protein
MNYKVVVFCLKCHCVREGKFCRYCGEKLVTLAARCKCGAETNPFDYYCIECGKKCDA